MNLKCVNENSGTGEFEQAAEMYLDLQTRFNMNVTYYVTAHLEMFKLSLVYTGDNPDQTHFNPQSKAVINTVLFGATAAIVSKVNSIFLGGRSFPNLLRNTPLCWLNIDQIYLSPNYPDSFLWGGLTPNYVPDKCPSEDEMSF